MKKHLLSAAIEFATVRHREQFDAGHNPYILHCLTVMMMVPSEDEELKAIAVLHDVIEDHKFTKATYQDLKDIGMTPRILEGVRCLTKVPGETYEEYKEKVKSNPDSIVVKKVDLKHNSDLGRLKNDEVSQKDIERMTRYLLFYAELVQHEKRMMK